MAQDAVLMAVDARGVATITFNRPETHNAFNDQMIAQFNRALVAVADDPAIRLLVLSASGRHFCSGADVNWMRRMVHHGYEDNLADVSQLSLALDRCNRLGKPIIARVHGAAYGVGIGLISCCDVAIADEQAYFCLSEVKVGLVPAVMSPYVIQAMGARASRRYFITGEPFSAAVALNLGLVHEVVPAEALDETVAGVAAAILENGPRAVAAAKKLVAHVSGKDINEALQEDTSETIAQMCISDEAQEGFAAFLEKRKPKWLP
jgi:methylglutaconyl-CoA hydratase